MTESDLSFINKVCNTNYFNQVENQYVNLYFLYTINGTFDEYKKLSVPLTLGTLTKETLMSEILKNRTESGRRFNVTGIYAYKFTEKDSDLISFLTLPSKDLHEVKQITSIQFPATIELFQHHNSVFVFMSSEQMKKSRKNVVSNHKKTVKNL